MKCRLRELIDIAEGRMFCFLTSQVNPEDAGELNGANGFIDELRRCLPDPIRGLNICSHPDSWEITDFYAGVTRGYFEDAGFRFETFRVLDSRNEAQAEELVRSSNLLILSGGHVPTQNRFFQRIGLRELLHGFSGVVVGISAGSMNAADVVYAQPEEEGEGVDPDYRKFLPGLGLTKVNLLPHYQRVKDDILDGLRLFEDITCEDSMGRTFYAIPDGSYLFIRDGQEELRGEAYRIRDGRTSQISRNGQRIVIRGAGVRMNLVRMEAPDADRLAPLAADFRVTLNGYRGIASSPKVEAAKEEILEFLNAGFPIYAVEDGSELAGYMVCRIDAPCLWVEHLFVRDEYRRRGVATLLFEKAEEIGRAMGEDTVFNFVHPNNLGMIGFLRSKGYTVLNMIEIRKPYPGEQLKTTIPVGDTAFDY